MANTSDSDITGIGGSSSTAVLGPTGAPTAGTVTDNAIVRWDGTTGTLVQNSNIMVADADAQGSVAFSVVPAAPLTYEFVRGGVSKGDIGFVATQKLASLTVKAGANITGLTGTTGANGSTTVTGTGTLFLEELSELDSISVSSASSSYRTVKNIASNTSLTVTAGIGNNTTQTINRKRSIQTWRDASGNFIGGISPDGSFLIGPSNLSDIYFSNKLYGTLTVVKNTSALIGSFHDGLSRVSEINGNGVYKEQVGLSGVNYPVSCVIDNTYEQASSGYTGSLTSIFNRTIPAYTFNSRYDAVRIKIWGDSSGGAAATFRVQFAGTNILDFTGGVSTTGDWEINILIVCHIGGAEVKTTTTIVTTPKGGGAPDGAVQYAIIPSMDFATGNVVDLSINDYTTSEVRHQGSLSEWLPSSET